MAGLKKTQGQTIFDTANISVMLLLMLITLYPLIYVAFASISDGAKLMAHQGFLVKPMGFSLEAYKMVFRNPMIGKGYENTLFFVVVGTALNMILTCFGAYGLSRKKLRLRDPIMFMIVFTMFFSGGLIPLYLIVQGMGLMNTYWAVLLPAAIDTMNLIILRTAFQSLPDSMEESAKIDGANDFIILFRIIIPLSMPVIAVMILFYGVIRWNAWFYASIFLRNRKLYPIQLILRDILILNSTDTMMTNVKAADRQFVGETIKYATIIVATLPILFVYPYLQKYFVKGIMIGAIKG